MMNQLYRSLNLQGCLVYSLGAAFLIYVVILCTSPSIMTQSLMRDLDMNAAQLGTMLAWFFLSYTVLQSVAGLLYDRFSTRLIMTLSLVISVWGVIFFGLAHNPNTAALGRFFTGVGAAFAYVGAAVIVSRWMSPRYFAFFFSINQVALVIGYLLAFVPSAWIVNHYSWRTLLHIIAVGGAILAILVWFIIRDRATPSALINDFSEQPSAWESIKEVCRKPHTWWLALYTFTTFATAISFLMLWAVPYLITRYQTSNTTAAWVCTMYCIGLGIASPIVGWLSDKRQKRCFYLSTCAVIGLIVMTLIIYLPKAALPLPLMCILFFILGFITAASGLSFVMVRDHNRHAVFGVALGLNNMAGVLGALIFQPLVGLILQYHWDSKVIEGIPTYSLLDYQYALLIFPLCYFISFLVSRFFLKESYPNHS